MTVSTLAIKPSKHLIAKIEYRPLAEVCDDLIAARNYLVKYGRLALVRAADIDATAAWGSSVKRVKVILPAEGRPDVVSSSIHQHSLVEVLNQCATLDRLLDALEWIQRDPRLAAFTTVECCHPTTSSSKKKDSTHVDNDLILVASDGRRARFEVSDVASEEDGNDKEQKDLISLGALSAGAARLEVTSWPGDLLFLVVSQELSIGICRRVKRAWRKAKHLDYQIFDASETTKVMEVIKGSGFRGAI